MPIVIACPGCKTNLRIEDNTKSPVVRCPHCSAVVSVPGNSQLPAGKVTVTRPNVPPLGTQHNGRQGEGSTLWAVLRWASMILAILASLSAAGLAIVRPGVVPEVGYAVAGLAIVCGLLAVVFSLISRGAMFGTAITALFLGVASLLFSINFTAAANTRKAAADVMAKAVAKEEEVRKDREGGEQARKEAAEILKKAEEAPARAEDALKKTEEAKTKTNKMLEDIKDQHRIVDAKRNQIAAEAAELATAQVKIKEEKQKIEQKKSSLTQP
jgi:hypothetical protein